MIIIGLSNSYHLAKEVARRLNVPYIRATSKISYDGEMHINFGESVKGKKVFLVQSFYPNQNNSLVEVLFASNLAKDLGAREVNLVAPYLPYLREDMRKDKFECVSAKNFGNILSSFVDSILSVDPHLNNLNKYFSVPIHTLSSSELIKHHIKKNYNDVMIVGPDENSRGLVTNLGFRNIILNKKRKDEFNVEFDKGYNLKDKKVIIIDDMIVTGSTMLGSLKYLGLKNADFITVHPLLKNDTLLRLKEFGNVISCNTINNETNVIDVSRLIAGKIKNEWCS